MSEMTGKCQKIDSHSLMLGYLDGDNLDNDEREMLLFALYCESVSQPESIAQKAIKQLNEQGRTNGKPPAAPAAAEPRSEKHEWLGPCRAHIRNEDCCTCGWRCTAGSNATACREQWKIHTSPLAEPVPQSEPPAITELRESVRATIINTVREHFQHGPNIDRREWLEEKLTERVDETLDGIHSLAAPSPAETSQASAGLTVEECWKVMTEYLLSKGLKAEHLAEAEPRANAFTWGLCEAFAAHFSSRAALAGPGDAKEGK